MRLYELPPAFAVLEALAFDGELTDDALARLDALEVEREEWLEGCCQALRNLEAGADVLEAEASRFRQRAAPLRSSAARLKAHIHKSLEKMGIERIDTKRFRLRIQTDSPHVEIYSNLDMDLLRADYLRVETSVNKKALLDAYRRGEKLPEGVRVSHGRSLRIS